MTVRRKLFFSFLILAFLPTASLILLSYYLATEGSRLLAARGVSGTLATADSLAMWVVEREQQQMSVELRAIAETEPTGAVEPQLALSAPFDLLIADDSIIQRLQLTEAEISRVAPEMFRAVGGQAAGRMVLGDRLFVWVCVPQQSGSICGGKFLSERYFQLASRVIEGETRFRSLSKTLLPVGQDLLLKIAVALVAISLILSLLAAQMLSYSMSAPLEKLVEATKRIRRGDLKHRIPPGARDEIGALIANFNQMTAKLEKTTEDLITAEREMTWRETARTIAHEIKNLLTPVNVALYKIKQKLSESPESDADLSRSVEVLAVEVDAIADLARQFSLFAHPPKLVVAELDLTEVIAESIAIHKERASHHEISVSVAAEVTHLTADRDLLRRALSNLVKNSLEATPYGGAIVISVKLGNGDTLIEVRDDGPGADQAIDLTLPYVTTKKSGTGLGLAIVKRVCEAHGWSLSYENASPGFLVTITVPRNNE